MRAIVFGLLLAAGPAFASQAIPGEMIARQGDNSVRLTQEPCPVPVLQVLPEGTRGVFRLARVSFDGKNYEACWAIRSDGMVYVQYDDGDAGLIPMQTFSAVPDA